VGLVLLALLGCQAEDEGFITDPEPESCMQPVRVDVWSDADGDGEFDPDETPLPDVLLLVTAEDLLPEEAIEQTTGEDGRAYFGGFEFDDCSPEGYSVLFARQVTGYAFPADPVFSLDGFDMLNDVVAFGLRPLEVE
jgi:hypothetical protein